MMGAAEGKQCGATKEITEDEKNIIRETWKVIKKNKVDFSITMFIKFESNLAGCGLQFVMPNMNVIPRTPEATLTWVFEKAPTSQDMFPQLSGIPLNELRAYKPMKAHGLRVFSSLNNVVDELDDTEVLVEMMKNVATTHYHRNVVRAHYDILGEAVLETLKEHLGDDFNERAKAAWGKAYGAMEEAIIINQDAIKAQQG